MTKSNFLQEIVSQTARRIAQKKKETPPNTVQAAAIATKKPLDFALALNGPDIKLIAEIKRASPSKGLLYSHPDIDHIAISYSRGGAAAISVLTEPSFFQGSYQDLIKTKAITGLPVLCKDFILEDYQVFESRVYGADAILLIAAIHETKYLRSLLTLANNLGLSVLTEVHNEREVQRALDAGASLIGINNRNLEDFSVDLNTTLRLRHRIPAEIPVVSESGIHFREDVVLLRSSGVQAVLIGETLITSDDPVRKIEELLGKAEIKQS